MIINRFAKLANAKIFASVKKYYFNYKIYTTEEERKLK